MVNASAGPGQARRMAWVKGARVAWVPGAYDGVPGASGSVHERVWPG